jgi:hypothetical protein
MGFGFRVFLIQKLDKTLGEVRAVDVLQKVILLGGCN